MHSAISTVTYGRSAKSSKTPTIPNKVWKGLEKGEWFPPGHLPILLTYALSVSYLTHLMKNIALLLRLTLLTFLPVGAFAQDKTGNYITGDYAGYFNKGSYNFFVGPAAGYSNTYSSYNSFLGYRSGFSNIWGTHNSFIGPFSGYFNIKGSHNTFIGPYAGYMNTTGHSNNFIGASAGHSNTTGYSNSFLGTYAGHFNTTGHSNSFMGTYAGYKNTAGSSNSFLGTYAGYTNTLGYSNSFMGNSAGYFNTTGHSNSFVGYQAGYKNTTGVRNTLLGMQAGYNNTTGELNSFVGIASGQNNTAGHQNVYLGAYAGRGNTTGANNTFVGTSSGSSTTIGSNNVSVGNFSGASLPDLSNTTALGYRAQATAANSLVLGSINGINGATVDVNVGIGTTAPAYRLQLGSGQAAKPGSSAWVVASDQKLKKDVSAFTDGLKVVRQIKPVWFRYNGLAGMPQNKQFVGIVAQEMQQIAPYTIGQFSSQDSTGKKAYYLDYDAGALPYILVNAMKEQQQQIEEQQQLNQQKEARIASLEVRLKKLEQLLEKQSNLPSAESSEAARLWQNEPNPTDGLTVIRYRIPTEAFNAEIKLFNLNGQELHSFLLSERGEGQLTIPTHLLASGTYVYRLLVDGNGIDAKKLLVVK
jgi:hypothetical protein